MVLFSGKLTGYEITSVPSKPELPPCPTGIEIEYRHLNKNVPRRDHSSLEEGSQGVFSSLVTFPLLTHIPGVNCKLAGKAKKYICSKNCRTRSKSIARSFLFFDETLAQKLYH